jgi:hypothetical protein
MGCLLGHGLDSEWGFLLVSELDYELEKDLVYELVWQLDHLMEMEMATQKDMELDQWSEQVMDKAWDNPERVQQCQKLQSQYIHILYLEGWSNYHPTLQSTK